MATYFVNSAGTNTAPYDTWTKAATTFATALAAATSTNDVIKVHYTHTEELAADTVFTFNASLSVICVDKDSSDALTVMGTGAWIGNSTLNRSVTMLGTNRNLYIYGLTLRTAGTTADSLSLSTGDGLSIVYDSCYFWRRLLRWGYWGWSTGPVCWYSCCNG